MKTLGLGLAAMALAGAVYWQMTGTSPAIETAQELPNGALVAVTLPTSLSAEAQMGQRAFEAKCATCHGSNAAGQDGVAPPLIHKIYEPSHHGDMAFILAAERGVTAHHWPFGDMPRIEGVTRADVMQITRYIREIQEANGIL